MHWVHHFVAFHLVRCVRPPEVNSLFHECQRSQKLQHHPLSVPVVNKNNHGNLQNHRHAHKYRHQICRLSQTQGVVIIYSAHVKRHIHDAGQTCPCAHQQLKTCRRVSNFAANGQHHRFEERVFVAQFSHSWVLIHPQIKRCAERSCVYFVCCVGGASIRFACRSLTHSLTSVLRRSVINQSHKARTQTPPF